MSEQILSVPTAFGPLKFITDDAEPDTMILDEIITLNRYQVLWHHLDGFNVLDIGSHKGMFTIMAAAAGAHVRAFEPNPQSLEILKRNIELNGLSERVLPLHAGVWSSEGMREFCGPKNSSGCAGTVDALNPAYADYNHFKAHCMSFGQAVEGKQWRFMKMDVEGAEVEIINSASEASLRSIQRFGMELHGSSWHGVFSKLEPIFRISELQENYVAQYLYGDRR